MKNTSDTVNVGIFNTEIVNEVIEFVNKRDSQVFELKNINVKDSTIVNNVTISLSKSLEYADLTERLKELVETLSFISEDNQLKRLELQAKVNHQKEVIKKYVEDTLRFANELNRIEINTERLIRVKEHFEKGEIKEARAVFQNEIEQMTNEYEKLINEKEHYEKEILPKLKNKSQEFLLFALSTKTDYSNPNRFADICKYFNYSVKSFPTKHNQFLFASFLQENKRFDEAETEYKFIIEKYANDLEDWEKASLYENLGYINLDKKNTEEALDLFSKSLEMWEKLSKEKTSEYEISVVDSLSNLAEVYLETGEIELSITHLEEALIKCRKLFDKDSARYSGDLISVLNNLGNAKSKNANYLEAAKNYIEAWEILEKYKEQNLQNYSEDKAKIMFNLGVATQFNGETQVALTFHLESFQIREQLAKLDANKFLPDLADSHFRLGEVGFGVFSDEIAFEHLTKALQIYDDLAQKYPEVYISKVAMIFYLLASIYQKNIPQREQSINFALQAIRLLLPIYQHSAEDQTRLERSLDILTDWGLNDAEVQKLISGENQ